MITISCFSYKGGAGRTTLAMNIVPYLARSLKASIESPLILVDMDVDSCGITYFLNLENYDRIDRFSVQALFGANGAVQKDDEAETAAEHILFRNLCDVSRYFNAPCRSILCLPAEPGAALGLNNNYDGNPIGVEKFLRECLSVGCCAVLFDSAVGDQLTANWSNAVSDNIICCMRPTEQFREGTRRFFDKFDKNIGRNKKIVVVPNVVPTDPLDIDSPNGILHYPGYAKEKIMESFADNIERGYNSYDLSMLKGDLFGIPKLDRFMWHESVLSTASNLTKIEEIALQCYSRLADLLCEQ